MFTKRHEQELAEIRALTYELGQRCNEILKELERIKDAQARLAARDRRVTPSDGGRGGRGQAKPVDGAKRGPKGKAAKKPRGLQPAAQAAGAKQAKRRAAAADTPKTGADGAAAGKRRGGGARRRRQPDLAPSSDSDES
jgi:hypothetical protein